MSDTHQENAQPSTHTVHTSETHTVDRSGGMGIGVIVGILLVVVALLAFFMLGGPTDTASETGDGVTVNVEASSGDTAPATDTSGTSGDGTADASAESDGGDTDASGTAASE